MHVHMGPIRVGYQAYPSHRRAVTPPMIFLIIYFPSGSKSATFTFFDAYISLGYTTITIRNSSVTRRRMILSWLSETPKH